jgi:hypothetical protein
LFLILVVNLAWAAVRVWRQVSTDNVVALLAAFALIGITLFARIFALQAQDRVIRLEETLRMERLLPADLKARMGELTSDQFVALRFASDGELADLLRAVLDAKLTDRKEIKRKIKQWRPDFHRV